MAVSYAFDDAQVALGAVSQRAQSLLVAGALVRLYSLLDAVELDDDDPLY